MIYLLQEYAYSNYFMRTYDAIRYRFSKSFKMEVSERFWARKQCLLKFLALKIRPNRLRCLKNPKWGMLNSKDFIWKVSPGIIELDKKIISSSILDVLLRLFESWLTPFYFRKKNKKTWISLHIISGNWLEALWLPPIESPDLVEHF